MATSRIKSGNKIINLLMKTASRTREPAPTNLMLDSWTDPGLNNFLFPQFIEELASDFPCLEATKSYLENKGTVQFGARTYLPQVSYAAQILHNLSPCHLALHGVSHFGAKPGLVLGNSSADRDLLSGRVEMQTQFVTGNSDIEVGFNGPLCFTVGPKAQPSVVFMIIPLPDGKGHIYEMANFAPKWSLKNNHLPALAAFVMRFLPRVFRTLFMIGYVEDLPLYNRINTLEQLIAQIHISNNHSNSNKSNADTMIQSSYFAAHQLFIENGSFAQMMQVAQSIGNRYAVLCRQA